MYRTVVVAIEESDEVARSVLDDATPKLHAAAERLVEVAHNREKAATAAAELQALKNVPETHARTLQSLEDQVRSADVEITETYESLVSLRAKVAQISTANSPENRATAAQLNASLDELNTRLEALEETMAPQQRSDLPE